MKPYRNLDTALVQVEEVNILRVVKSEFKEANSIDEMIAECFGKNFEQISKYIDSQHRVISEIEATIVLKEVLRQFSDLQLKVIQLESDLGKAQNPSEIIERMQDHDGGKDLYVTTHEIIKSEDL